MTTRAAIIAKAIGKLLGTDSAFDVTPDERADVRRELDAMMAEWEAEGLILAYTPSADADNDAKLMTTPTWADAAIWNNLAMRMAGDFGRTPSGSLRKDARRGYALVSAKALKVPRQQQANSTIHGGGERYYRRYGW